MLKVAFLFPGQGSQRPNFLNDLPKCDAVNDVIETASEILNESVYNLHSETALVSTKAVQLCLLVSGVAVSRAFATEGVIPDFVAGHSVGAFSAAVAAGVIDFKDALNIVSLRGELMEKTHPDGYGMGVVLGMDVRQLRAIVHDEYNEKFPVYIANQNAPDQITISGSIFGIKKVLEEASKKGIRCARMLNVRTPSHCQLLTPVSKALLQALKEIPFYPPKIPYAGNRRARLLYDPNDIRQDLAESVSSPVQWHDAATVLYEKGTNLFIEMPPGNVLSQLAIKAFPDARVLSIEKNGFDDCQYVALREQMK